MYFLLLFLICIKSELVADQKILTLYQYQVKLKYHFIAVIVIVLCYCQKQYKSMPNILLQLCLFFFKNLFDSPWSQLLHANKRIFVFSTWALSWGMQDVVPLPEVKPGPPGLQAQSLNHWTTLYLIFETENYVILFLVLFCGRCFRISVPFCFLKHFFNG